MKIIDLLNNRFTSTLFVLFTAMQLSACSSGEPTEPTMTYLVDPSTPTVTYVNHAAIISGVDRGSVTEDIDADADNLLQTGGTLAITEIDADEDAFLATSIDGTYGSLVISADGTWNYSADNTQAVIQNLTSGTSLSDSLTISSVDGTPHTVVITINGTDEASAPITVTGPVEPDAPVTVTEPVEPDVPVTVTEPDVTNTAININLSWIAPSVREDNTPLSLSAIGGYNVYYGNMPGQYVNTININDGSADSYTFTNLPAGTYYFVVTTYDADGRESQYSPVITKTI